MSNMRLLLGTLICLFCVFLSNAARAEELGALVLPPHLVVDVGSGEVLSEHRMDQRWAPASLTKMMTAYTVFKTLELGHLALNSPVRVSESSLQQPPTKMGYPIGTIMTIETALKIILVKSANDISVALAESTSGSEETFVSLMNSHARRLGMTDSQFTNPHGLHHPEQYTSARDMAILTRALTREFAKYDAFFDIPYIRITNRRLRNHNALLRLFEGTTGMKTGYVCASGYNLVARVKRGDRVFAAIIFGGHSGLSRNVKAARLLTDAYQKLNSYSGPVKSIDQVRDQNEHAEPDDFTRIACPRKYSAVGYPRARPSNAPKAADFAPVDTQVQPAKSPDERGDRLAKVIPNPRPVHTSEKKAIDQSALQGEETAIAKELAKPEQQEVRSKSIAELAEMYLKPVAEVKEQEKLVLGGATGPNPFGIKHTKGGRYIAPTPVPKTKPDT